MKILKPVYSKTAPNLRDALWLKPVDGGFAAYVLEGGTWVPQKPMDDNNTASEGDDVVQDLIGSVQDSSSANTINGAKAYAQAVGSELVGDPSDAETNMTLHGLKNYIDSQIQALG